MNKVQNQTSRDALKTPFQNINLMNQMQRPQTNISSSSNILMSNIQQNHLGTQKKKSSLFSMRLQPRGQELSTYQANIYSAKSKVLSNMDTKQYLSQTMTPLPQTAKNVTQKNTFSFLGKQQVQSNGQVQSKEVNIKTTVSALGMNLRSQSRVDNQKRVSSACEEKIQQIKNKILKKEGSQPKENLAKSSQLVKKVEVQPKANRPRSSVSKA